MLGVCVRAQEEQLGKDPSTFFTFDFFLHDTQATPVLASNAPTYDTLVQYVVDQDPFLLQYLDTHVLELELNRCEGWWWAEEQRPRHPREAPAARRDEVATRIQALLPAVR